MDPVSYSTNTMDIWSGLPEVNLLARPLKRGGGNIVEKDSDCGDMGKRAVQGNIPPVDGSRQLLPRHPGHLEQ